jgi:tagaturonate reductase
MQRLSSLNHPIDPHPERVIQFGEGNFLRGFIDWMIHRLNRSGRFGGRVVVVQPIAQGLAKQLNEQHGLYTLLLRGVQDGKPVDHREVISSVSRALNPYEQFDEFLALARNPRIDVIVSNTTEAGIVFRAEDKPDDRPPASFPAKLTRLLWERFRSLGRSAAPGFVILPCELIERNGEQLRNAVLRTAGNWKLPDDFAAWIDAANEFATTLVDRIVTGYPRDEAAELTAELGYEDELLVAAEPFHFFAVERAPRAARLLPFHEVGLDVVFADDITPYRDRKVRILNGAHTMTALAAYLMGLDTVGQCMDDDLIRSFMRRGLDEEIIPTLNLPKRELEDFAAAVVERFGNPHVKHALPGIALNSTSKFRARLLPSIRRFIELKGRAPARLSFALAALIAFYRGREFSADGTTLRAVRAGGQDYHVQDDR